MELDPRTLAFYTVAIAAILTLLTAVQRLWQRTYPGFGWWVFSLAAFSGALASIALRGLVPAPLVDFGPSWFGMLSMLAVHAGQDRFLGGTPRVARAAALVLAGAATTLTAELAGLSQLRNATGALTVGALAMWCAWRFVQHHPPGLRRAAWLCAAVLALIGATRLWRAGFFLVTDPSVDVLAGSTASTFNYTVNAVFATLWGFAFVLLNASRLERDLAASRDELQRIARTDPLTGLRNRRALFEQGSIELLRAKRYRLPISLLMIDIDHFKSVNDRFGHMSGDELLAAIARTIAGQLRATDIVARFGGEEIVALLVQTPPEEAAATAERLRRAIGATTVDGRDGAISATASIGVAAAADGDVELDELLRHADAALYQAKLAGRDRVVQA